MPNQNTENKNPRRGIYLLPNLLTTGGLFAGFFAIVASMGGRFEVAAVAIFIAMIMDGLDGRVARMTNTQSAFGAEYDSMADIVSFGVAPALVTYNWALTEQGKLGWLAAFIFVAAGALRLARFNTQVETADKSYFQGLAIPSAAAILAGMVWLGVDSDYPSGTQFGLPVAIITICLGLLMVSNFRYSSFKEVNWRGKVPFIAILVSVLILVLIAYDPPIVLFIGFSIYALSGPVLTVVRMRSLKDKRGKTEAEAEEENSNKPTE
ncbi:CDP-diacylglycerol--serine O-phosphatidyltransferase [Pleionea sp. CnH1-48]|uniref:CDP-diacylglycerol--serine O-phosphatidyltransferase n=1 Tax=Pleionea sp. CnH1-48 TaxID=2954494 RepID=UPI0020969F7F|nr:CDP-diacylglycerol--serine O-phosphatidyltransferase [Pleionea sp. CnH1-48]MCO7225298.1 CDP-diacylglycerol--serine O-phosphatidyltransferase [Pleionea sp. CnH1-48]